MEISINVEKLNEIELSPSEFVILKLLHDREYQVLENLMVGELGNTKIKNRKISFLNGRS